MTMATPRKGAPRKTAGKRTTADKKSTAAKASKGLVEVYEGRDVLQTTLQVTGAGDGLSEAMAIEPQIMHHGEVVYVVLECEVAKVQYPKIKDTDSLARLHTLKAGRATIVDKDLVIEAINSQHVRIVAARDAAAGQGSLGLDGPSVLRGEHTLGDHAAGLVEGCTLCDDEQIAAELEASGEK